MRKLLPAPASDAEAGTGSGVLIADEVFALALPPPAYGLVTVWSDPRTGCPGEIDLEIWSNATITLTGAILYGAALHPLTNPDDTFVADATGGAAEDMFTAASHGLLSGDGPFRVSNAGGALPAGLAAGTDYWIIKLTDNTFQLAASLVDALDGTAVQITTDGTGVQTIADTATTMRVHWHSHGLLGLEGDGEIALTAQLAYAERIRHRPRTVAYALAASLSTSDPEWVSAALYPVIEKG